MKISWGTGLAAGFAFFLLLMLALAGISLSSRTDVVTDHYYAEGLRYQNQIAALQRTVAREEKLIVRLAGQEMTIQFPRGIAGRELRGTITLYRPSDGTCDIILPVHADSAGIQALSIATMDRGLWKLRISWREGVEEFYQEQPFMVL